MKANEFDTNEDRTKEYEKYTEMFLSDFNLGDLMKCVDYIYLLCSLINEENEIVDEARELIYDLDTKIVKFQTGADCEECGNYLYISDLPQYNEVCYVCDENF